MATPTAPPNTPKTTTSVDPLYKLATAQAKTALDAETAPLIGQQATSDAYFKQRSVDAGKNAAALSELLKGIGPAVGDTYETAAQNQTLAASGFSHGMQDALQGRTDNLNAMLERLGAPTQLDSHAAEAGDVAYGKGYYPALALRSSGAALKSAADELPGTALLRGQENQKQIGIQSASAHAGFDAKIAELAGKLPGDIQANYSKLQTLALANKRFREQVANDKFNQAYKTAEHKLAIAKYNTGIDEFNAKQTLAYKKLAVQESQFAQRQRNSDRSYAISLARLGIAQKGLQLKIAANAFKQAHGGYTASQVRGFNQKLDSLVAGGAPTRPVQTTIKGKDGNGDPYTDTGMNTPTPQYQDKSGKWHDITPTTVLTKGTRTRNSNTYANFVTAALKKGVPIQLALERADSIWPETQRTLPPALKNLPAVAAEAAQQTADYNQMTGVGAWGGAKYGKVTISPGADRAGVSTVPEVKSFVAALAGRLKTTLTIGTGTNHNEMTTDGNVSDHWTGHAADVPLSGAALTRAGQQALILAGADPAWARKQTGGLFNINTPEGRVQIIFNSMQGGNHFNHLHVGVK